MKLSQLVTSLRTLLVIPFTLLIFIAVGSTGYFALHHGQQAVNEVTLLLRQEITARIQQHLHSYFQIPHLVNQLNADAIQLGLLDTGNSNLLERYFWRQLQRFQLISGIYWGNEAGGIVAVARYDQQQITVQVTAAMRKGDYYTYATDAQGQRTRLLEVANHYDATQRPWYLSAATAHQPVWSQVYSFTYPAGSLGITANQPVYDEQGQLKGVLAADFMLTQISEFLKTLKIGHTGQVYIMERNGRLIASSTEESPFIERTSNNADERLMATHSQMPIIQLSSRYLIEHFKTLNQVQHSHPLNFQACVTPSFQSINKLDCENSTYYLQVTPIQDHYGLDWLIVVVVPEADFLANVTTNTRFTVLFSIAIAMLITLIMGVILSHWVLNPIFQLNDAAKALAKGDWQTRIHVDRQDEIGQLGQAFDKMSQQLQNSFIVLEQAYLLAESARQIAETANRAKTSFLANMSHELRTPLNAVLGYSHLLQEEALELGKKECLIYLENIQQSGQALLALISDILEFSKIEAEKMPLHLTTVPIQTLLEEVIQSLPTTLINRNCNQLTYHCPHDLPPLITDADKLKRILQNLLHNAYKFTHQGQIHLQLIPADNGLYFQITDTGIGIPTERIPSLFEPFQQADNSSTRLHGGAGLGLAICQQYCHLLGGKITVDSQLGIGSLFTLYCPSHPQESLENHV